MLIWFEYTASQGRLSIRIAGMWKSTGINLRKFLRSQCQLALENETLRKYFPKSYTPKQMEDTIIKLLEGWYKKRQLSQER